MPKRKQLDNSTIDDHTKKTTTEDALYAELFSKLTFNYLTWRPLALHEQVITRSKSKSADPVFVSQILSKQDAEYYSNKIFYLTNTSLKPFNKKITSDNSKCQLSLKMNDVIANDALVAVNNFFDKKKLDYVIGVIRQVFDKNPVMREYFGFYKTECGGSVDFQRYKSGKLITVRQFTTWAGVRIYASAHRYAEASALLKNGEFFVPIIEEFKLLTNAKDDSLTFEDCFDVANYNEKCMKDNIQIHRNIMDRLYACHRAQEEERKQQHVIDATVKLFDRVGTLLPREQRLVKDVSKYIGMFAYTHNRKRASIVVASMEKEPSNNNTNTLKI